MIKTKFRSGFTLIELLVVISIIGILSAVLYGSFSEARQDSKNKALRSELKEVQLSLELYKAQNGQYPDVPAAPCGAVISASTSVALSTNVVCISNGFYIKDFVPEFMANLPSHTKAANSNCVIEYMVDNTNFSWYKLTAKNCYGGATSAANGIQPDDEFARCLSTCSPTGICDPASADFYESYAIFSSGGQCQ